ncbi:MAG: DUF1883 domain-containing protein [Pirellulaceae bacterium]|nr:DUF1883 domain-containing protein [Planctomycetales bacterium]
MQEHLHKRLALGEDEFVRIDSDTPCNALLLDDDNYASYRKGEDCEYVGGFVRDFPTPLFPPSAGEWNVVIDLAGSDGTIKCNITKAARTSPS